MKQIQLKQQGGYYGIIEDGEVVIPFEHPTKESAVDEWTMWERENIKCQFLPHVLTDEEIKNIAKKLLSCLKNN